jgi:integrase
MAATIPSTSLVPVQPVFSDAERLALAGFLAGYRGLTREAYALDLRQFTGWCRARPVPLFSVRRADIETFARELEARGRARAAVTRRLCTIAGFYKYAVEEELIDHPPAVHVRRPRLDYESHATALHRNELGALLVAAGLGPPAEHALMSLLALNGLRVSEATGADIEHLGLGRGGLAGDAGPDADGWLTGTVAPLGTRLTRTRRHPFTRAGVWGKSSRPGQVGARGEHGAYPASVVTGTTCAAWPRRYAASPG